MKFDVGDRVTRPRNVYKKSPLMHGTVSRAYSCRYDSEELYDVSWDRYGVPKGYLAHGLKLEVPREK